MKRMKNTIEIFDENLKVIVNMLKESNYAGCNRISRKLITVATMSNFKDGVFISEILEGIFDQLDDVVTRYEVDGDKLKKLNMLLIERGNTLVEALKNNSNEKLYEILKEMRYSVTEFQINSFNTTKRKPSSRFGHIVDNVR